MASSNNPIAGPLIGLIVFLIGFPLLWWNEKIAVQDYLTIGDMAKKTEVASADAVNPEFDGKPVHLTAAAETDAILKDEQFGLEVNALRLNRSVEMYQWRENRASKKEKEEEGKQTTYSKEWSSSAIPSDDFEIPQGHENPEMPGYGPKSWSVDSAQFGAYTLPKFLIERIQDYEPVNMAEIPKPEGAQLIGNGFYIGADPNTPQVGDIRIIFKKVRPQTISLIAQQSGETFTNFLSEKTGKTWVAIATGSHDKDALIAMERSKVKLRTWILRGAGFLCMFVGLLCIVQPMRSLVGAIPLLGSIVDAGVVFINFLVAASLSLIVILIAWLAARPVLSISLGVAALVLIILVIRMLASRSKAKG